jgi:hypothetical protein
MPSLCDGAGAAAPVGVVAFAAGSCAALVIKKTTTDLESSGFAARRVHPLLSASVLISHQAPICSYLSDAGSAGTIRQRISSYLTFVSHRY